MPGADLAGRNLSLTVRIDGRRYGTRHVLGQVHFDVAPGEMVALLAPSGTGKSTILRIVMGLDHDFTGTVSPRPERIGAVFQEPRLLPWATVADNLRLVAPTLTEPAIAELLAAVSLEGAAHLRPGQLSLGMARRVALARAWAARPALLVLDEAFASLDVKLAQGLAAAMVRRAEAAGTMVVMATHDLDQALCSADRVLVLGGTPASLVADVPAGEAASLRSRFDFLEGTSD